MILHFKTSTGNVDVENRIIRDVILADTISPKDYRRFQIDADFITEFVSLANKKKQIPVMSNHHWSAKVGDKVGYIDNVRAAGKKIIGDLHIYEAADISPTQPGIGSYILTAASEDKNANMLSINIDASTFYAIGTKRNVTMTWDYESQTYTYKHIDDNTIYKGNVSATPTVIYSVDIVPEGALTNNMFSIDHNEKHLFDQVLLNPNFVKYMENINNPPQPDTDNNSFFTKLKNFFIQMETTQAPPAAAVPPTPVVAPATETPPVQVAAAASTPSDIAAAVNAALAPFLAEVADLKTKMAAIAATAQPHVSETVPPVVVTPVQATTGRDPRIPEYYFHPRNAEALKQFKLKNKID